MSSPNGLSLCVCAFVNRCEIKYKNISQSSLIFNIANINEDPSSTIKKYLLSNSTFVKYLEDATAIVQRERERERERHNDIAAAERERGRKRYHRRVAGKRVRLAETTLQDARARVVELCKHRGVRNG